VQQRVSAAVVTRQKAAWARVLTEPLRLLRPQPVAGMVTARRAGDEGDDRARVRTRSQGPVLGPGSRSDVAQEKKSARSVDTCWAATCRGVRLKRYRSVPGEGGQQTGLQGGNSRQLGALKFVIVKALAGGVTRSLSLSQNWFGVLSE
jgi:hypothetical protein